MKNFKFLFFLLALFCALAAFDSAQAQSRKQRKKAKKVKTTRIDRQGPLAPPTEEAAPKTETEVEPAPASTAPRPAPVPRPVTAQPGTPASEPRPQAQIDIPNGQPVITQMPQGQVNWTTQYVTAKGSSVIDTERFKNAAQAKAMANRGAVVVAQRNLLEVIQGVRVVGETKVKDLITESDYIYTRVDGLIKGAEVVGEPVEKDGMIEVTMRVPLYSTDGLAAAFYDGQTNTAMRTAARQNPEMKLGELVTPSAETSGATASTGNFPEQLAFNLNGHKFDPSLFPVLVDENSKVIFDFSKLYDPTKGKFPQLLQTTRGALEQAGLKKGVEFIDIIKTAPGKLVVNDETKKKIMNWSKIGKTLFDIGKMLLLVI